MSKNSQITAQSERITRLLATNRDEHRRRLKADRLRAELTAENERAASWTRKLRIEAADLHARVAELSAERDAVRRQAEDATEYVLAQINQDLRARVAELEAERDRLRDDGLAAHQYGQRLETWLRQIIAMGDNPASAMARAALSKQPQEGE